MKLLTLNVDSKKFIDYANSMVNGKGAEVLFIDWLPTTGSQSQDVTYQIQIIESTPDDVQMIIFDRHSSMTPEEVDFFKNRGAILLEPVIKPRFGFLFMPYYIDKLDLPLSTWEKKRQFHFGYKGFDLSPRSERWLLKAIKEVPDVRVGASIVAKLQGDRYNTLKDVISIGDYNWNDFNITVITGSDTDYYRGVLPDITNHLKYGVVPLVHHKHKWFHALFKNFLIFDHYDISWYKIMYKAISYGMIDELYKNIETYLPEMITENFVSTIISLGEGK